MPWWGWMLLVLSGAPLLPLWMLALIIRELRHARYMRRWRAARARLYPRG